MNRHSLSDTFLSILLLAISAVGIILWNINCPECQDDFYYRTIMPDDNQDTFSDCVGPRIETFGDALCSAWHVQLYEHGRLANVLHILFTPFSPAIERVFTAILLLGCIIILSMLASGKKRTDAFAIAAATVLIWTCLPWYNCMNSLDFQANYVWSSFALLAYILLLPAAFRTQSRGRLFIFFLFCTVIAWGHEAFGITAGAYTLGLWPALSKKERCKTLYFIGALLIGFCIVMLCGLGNRFAGMVEYSYDFSSLKYMSTRMISYSWPITVAFSVFIVRFAVCKEQRRKYFIKSFPCILAMTASVIILAAVVNLWSEARVLWPGILIAALFLARNIIDITCKIPSGLKDGATAIFAIVYALWFISLVRWQIKLTGEHETIYTNALALADSPTEVYPGPYTSSPEVPFYLMGIVHNPLDFELASRHLTTSVKSRRDAQMMIAVVPSMTGLFGEWPEIPGNTGFRGVFPWFASTDTSIRRIHVVLGPPPANKTPIDKLLTRLKHGANSGNAEVDLNINYKKVFLPDSSVVFRVHTEPLGRTLAGRKVLRIDRAENQTD